MRARSARKGRLQPHIRWAKEFFSKLNLGQGRWAALCLACGNIVYGYDRPQKPDAWCEQCRRFRNWSVRS
jgi:hypothetical protein